MEGIGVVLLIIFAIASSINKRAIKSGQQSRVSQAKTRQPAPQSPLQKVVRQLQEAADKAMGQEAPKPARPARPLADQERDAEGRRGMEPAFRGSVAEHREAEFYPRQETPSVSGISPAPVVEKRLEAPQKMHLPWMNPNGLVQAVIAHEVLTRPRAARKPFPSALSRK